MDGIRIENWVLGRTSSTFLSFSFDYSLQIGYKSFNLQLFAAHNNDESQKKLSFKKTLLAIQSEGSNLIKNVKHFFILLFCIIKMKTSKMDKQKLF